MIRDGDIKAKKQGRSYVIPQSEVNMLMAKKHGSEINKQNEKAAYIIINEYTTKMKLELLHLLRNCSSLLDKTKTIHELEITEQMNKVFDLYLKGHLKNLFDTVDQIKKMQTFIDELQSMAKDAENMNSFEKFQSMENELERFNKLLPNLDDEGSRKEFQKLVNKWNDENE